MKLSPIDALEKLKSQIEVNLSEPLSAEDILDNSTGLCVPQIKSRCWVLLLYPDNDIHAEVLKDIFNRFLCVGALHDDDYNKHGKKIKDHYHVVVYFPSAVYVSHILSNYPLLEARFVQPRTNVKIQVRYLLHLDSPSKTRYPLSYLEGHVQHFSKYIDKDESEAKQVIDIINLIESGECSCLTDLVKVVCANGLYATYRRSAWTFNTILAHHIEKSRKGD